MNSRYHLSTDLEKMDFAKIHAWLSSSYWTPGISREKVEKAAHNSSLVIGAFLGEEQVGYLRVVSDKTSFAWICDVWVDESHRGNGIAKGMLNSALQDSDHQGLRRWVLATKDAHLLYASGGFHALDTPERWMIHYPNKELWKFQ